MPWNTRKNNLFLRSDFRLIYGSIKTCTNGNSIDFSPPNRRAHENRLLIPTQVCAPSRWVVPIKIFSRRDFTIITRSLFIACNAEPARRKILTWAKRWDWLEGVGEERHCREWRAINKHKHVDVPSDWKCGSSQRFLPQEDICSTMMKNGRKCVFNNLARCFFCRILERFSVVYRWRGWRSMEIHKQLPLAALLSLR